AGGNRKCPVHRIGTAMAADHVAIHGPRHRADDRPALSRICRTPVNGKCVLPAGFGVGCETDVVGSVRAAHVAYSKKPTARLTDGPDTDFSVAPRANGPRSRPNI